MPWPLLAGFLLSTSAMTATSAVAGIHILIPQNQTATQLVNEMKPVLPDDVKISATNNEILIDTKNSKTFKQIKAVLIKLDQPRPTVLIELSFGKPGAAFNQNQAITYSASKSSTEAANSDLQLKLQSGQVAVFDNERAYKVPMAESISEGQGLVVGQPYLEQGVSVTSEYKSIHNGTWIRANVLGSGKVAIAIKPKQGSFNTNTDMLQQLKFNTKLTIVQNKWVQITGNQLPVDSNQKVYQTPGPEQQSRQNIWLRASVIK